MVTEEKLQNGLPSKPVYSDLPDIGTKHLVGAPELTVVIPTFNEGENIPSLYRMLVDSLEGIRWEAIFVDDDSPDGTSDIAKQLALADARVRVIQRVGRRGLSSACIEGMLASVSPYVAVMDGDLQHDGTILPDMLNALKTDNTDIVVASRTVGDGSFGALRENRIKLSKFASRLTKLIT